MIRLVEPSERYLKSYMEAFAEYKAHHLSSYGLSDATALDILKNLIITGTRGI